MEWVVEWPLLVDRWKIILLGIIFQVRSHSRLANMGCMNCNLLLI